MKTSPVFSLPLLALGAYAAGDAALETRQSPTVNGTVEYRTMCKSCPYNLCINVVEQSGDDIVPFTCWTEGELIDDTDLWLRSTDGCYLPEYDLIEYEGDFREELEYCGEIPLNITEQDATVRYLSECKWAYGTSSESILFYGRDQDVTLTCWAEGGDVMDNTYWYKTTDNCHVSGSGLWDVPDLAGLENCGPAPGPRPNETRRSLENEKRDGPSLEDENFFKRWLQPEQIGEEYAPCHICPAPVVNSTCQIETTYEFNDTVVSQCTTSQSYTYPNGSVVTHRWMLTTDWCYVEGENFWVPPWDNYRYPRCDNWEGYI